MSLILKLLFPWHKYLPSIFERYQFTTICRSKRIITQRKYQVVKVSPGGSWVQRLVFVPLCPFTLVPFTIVPLHPHTLSPLCPHALLPSQPFISTTSKCKMLKPQSRTTMPSTFTKWQMAFIGPHYLPNILGQKVKTNHLCDSNEPPIISPKLKQS